MGESGPAVPSSLTIFLPAYNERENLAAAVAELDAAASSAASDYEIVIVEDGSTDGTAELADEMARIYPRVRAAHQPRNAGYGPAVLRGLAEATKDYVFYTDADRQYDYEQLITFWPLAQRCDVVAGYRRHRADPLTRHLFAAAYAALLKLFYGFRWRDADCSFKFFRRARIRDIVVDSRSGFVEAELLLKCRVHGLEIKQVPVRHYHRPAGQVSFELLRRGPLSIVKPGPIWAMWLDILRCRRRLARYARAVRRARFRRDMGLA